MSIEWNLHGDISTTPTVQLCVDNAAAMMRNLVSSLDESALFVVVRRQYSILKLL